MNHFSRSVRRSYKLIIFVLCLFKANNFLLLAASTENSFDNQIEKLLKDKPYLKIYVKKLPNERLKEKKSYPKYVASGLLALFTLYKFMDYYRRLYIDKSYSCYFLPQKLIRFSRGVNIMFLLLQIMIIKKLLFFSAELFENNVSEKADKKRSSDGLCYRKK